MSAFYPVYLDLRNRQSLVIGGNAEAEKRSWNAGGRRPGNSREPSSDGGSRAVDRGWRRSVDRPIVPGWGSPWGLLAISCIVDPAFSAPIWEEAQQEKVLLNAVDDVPHCHFSLRPSIEVGISRSPSQRRARRPRWRSVFESDWPRS